MNSNENTQPTRGVIDLLIDKMFELCKIITTIIAFPSLLCIVICSCYLLFGRNNEIEIPKYKESSIEDRNLNDDSAIEKDSPIALKYNAEIKKVVKLIGQTSQYRKEIIQIIDKVPGQHRTPFVEGLIEYLEEAKLCSGKRFSGTTSLFLYVQEFEHALTQLKNEGSVANERNSVVVRIIKYSICTLICLLVISLMIRIEESTRK